MWKDIEEIILRFFLEDIGGILIMNESGEILYEDAVSMLVKRDKTNWSAACPPPRDGQKKEMWDLLDSDSGKTYMVITSTVPSEKGLLQIHHLTDNSMYMELYRDMTGYSKALKAEKERDGLTGLYNKGKFMAMKPLFARQDRIAVFNMDVNNLKRMNDTYGHEAGDRLIKKAADSLRRIEARNVLAFRVGGDEFLAVALHVSRDEAEKLRSDWEAGLAELNQKDDGINCVVACGFAYGENSFDMDELLALADKRMYMDKMAKKNQQ